MCMGGGGSPREQQAPAPPPPPPSITPAAPILNEDQLQATQAETNVANTRRGRRSLRVDVNTQTGLAAGSTTDATAASGLNIPT